MVEMTCPVLGCDMGKRAPYKTMSMPVTTAMTLLNWHFTSGRPKAVELGMVHSLMAEAAITLDLTGSMPMYKASCSDPSESTSLDSTLARAADHETDGMSQESPDNSQQVAASLSTHNIDVPLDPCSNSDRSD